MVTYIYFVKCPNCEDEHFDFFDEAKAFAMGCLSQKPIITQTEVCRNDFGECTDHSDLGTIWSWEDECKECGETDAEPIKSVFTKNDLKLMADGQDPEFDNLDNSVDFEVEEPAEEPIEEPVTSEISPVDSIPDNFRKPIPEGMTIEELVEEMEDSEDTVECKWCDELYPKSECSKDKDLGWLCDRCQRAIASREGPEIFDWLEEFDEEEALTEAADYSEPEELYYDEITAEVVVGTFEPYHNGNNWESGGTIEDYVTAPWTYKVAREEVEDFLWNRFTDEYLEDNFPGGLAGTDDPDAVERYIDEHYDEWFEKYHDEILAHFYDDAVEDFSLNYRIEDPND